MRQLEEYCLECNIDEIQKKGVIYPIISIFFMPFLAPIFQYELISKLSEEYPFFKKIQSYYAVLVVSFMAFHAGVVLSAYGLFIDPSNTILFAGYIISVVAGLFTVASSYYIVDNLDRIFSNRKTNLSKKAYFVVMGVLSISYVGPVLAALYPITKMIRIFILIVKSLKGGDSSG